MLCVVVGQTKEYRKTEIGKITETVLTLSESLINLSDSDGDISLLQQYLYPSLFSLQRPVVHAKYVLSISEVNKKILEELHSSPTLYILEEFTLVADHKKMIKALIGDALYMEEKKEGNKNSGVSPFAFIDTIEKKGKKEVWIAYNELLSRGPIESALGMLLWGIRKLALRKGKAGDEFRVLYTNTMKAYADARAGNTPLQLAIEKVLLQR